MTKEAKVADRTLSALMTRMSIQPSLLPAAGLSAARRADRVTCISTVSVAERGTCQVRSLVALIRRGVVPRERMSTSVDKRSYLNWH